MFRWECLYDSATRTPDPPYIWNLNELSGICVSGVIDEEYDAIFRTEEQFEEADQQEIMDFLGVNEE